MQWPDPRTSLSTRTWPQWRGWKHCPVTGDLIDPDGQSYTPERVRAALWILQCFDLRDRLIYADTGPARPLLTTADMQPTAPQTKRQRAAYGV